MAWLATLWKIQCTEEEGRNNKGSAVVTEKIQDALLLSVDSSIDSLVMDSGTYFHTTTHHEIMKNYIVRNYGNIYLMRTHIAIDKYSFYTYSRF